MNERKWIDIAPGVSSLSAYEVSKKVINILRHSQTVQREDEFNSGESRIPFRSNFQKLLPGRTVHWKRMLGSRRSKEKIFYLRALQGHSGRNLIDPSLQDNVIIQSGFFQHIYHIGCAF